MKKEILTLVLIILSFGICFAQIDLKVGLYPKGSFVYNSKFSGNPGNELIYFLTPALQFQYQKICLIAKYSYSNGWSNLREIITRKSFHVSMRYYLLKDEKKIKWSSRAHPFIEIETSLLNWKYMNNEIIKLNEFNYVGVTPLLGFNIRILNNLFCEFGYGYRLYKDYRHPDLNFGITYRILEK